MKNLFPYISVDMTTAVPIVGGEHRHSFGYHLEDDDGFDDGHHASWNWDGSKLEASVDWLGIQPLFYGIQGKKVVISNNILRLLEQGVEPELDFGALGVFFRLGFMLGCDTIFKSIRAFAPGGRLVFENGEVNVSESYPQVDLVASTQKEEEEAYIELFRNSITRRAENEGSFIQPISGGRDSRHIIAELARQGMRPEYTYTVKTNYRDTPLGEEQIAAALAERLGLKHQIVTHPVTSELRREGLKNILTSFSCDEGSWMLGAIDHLSANRSALYDGFLGDVLSAFHWVNCGGGIYESYKTSGADGAVASIVNRLMPNTGAQDKFLKATFPCNPETNKEYAIERIREFFNKFSGQHNPITQFFIFSRGRREIAMSTWGAYPFVDKIYAPFLDRKFFLHFLSLAEREESSYAFSRSAAIARAYPEIANLPYAKTEPSSGMRALSRRSKVFGSVFRQDFSDVGCKSHALRRWALNKTFRRNHESLDISRLIFIQQLNAISQGESGRFLITLDNFLSQ